MAKGTTGHIDLKTLTNKGTPIPIRRKDRWRPVEINPVPNTDLKYWIERMLLSITGDIIIWQKDGERFKVVSHPIPDKLYSSMVRSHASWTVIKNLRRLCRMTKRQIDAENLLRAMDPPDQNEPKYGILRTMPLRVP